VAPRRRRVDFLSGRPRDAKLAAARLNRAEDLKGKKIGTARFGESSHISALIALEHLGLDLKRDRIALIQTGVDPDRMVALENKAIDRAMLQRFQDRHQVRR
jgi:ABC-type nitrate/sulfonate/bicarbonate transport system substrate-binding protein